jgi:hypothetical protein
MKNRSYLYIAAIFACIIIIYACKKVTPGYLSPNVFYQQNPIQIPKGRTFLSTPFNPDGSTQPYTVSVVHYYNSAGDIVDSLFTKKYPVTVFTRYIDPRVDTSFAQITSALKTDYLPPVSFLPASGQLSANAGALNLPGGTYKFDLKISNVAGTRIYPKIGAFTLVDTTNFDAVPAIGSTSESFAQVGNESISGGSGKAPKITITRIADTPNIVTVKYVDKNGTPWNPQAGEVIPAPYTGPPFLQCFQQYTSSYYYTSTSSVFRYPLTPFPLNSLGNGFNIYQRIVGKYVAADGKVAGQWHMRLRFPLRIFVPGSYLVVEQAVDATRIQP